MKTIVCIFAFFLGLVGMVQAAHAGWPSIDLGANGSVEKSPEGILKITLRNRVHFYDSKAKILLADRDISAKYYFIESGNYAFFDSLSDNFSLLTHYQDTKECLLKNQEKQQKTKSVFNAKAQKSIKTDLCAPFIGRIVGGADIEAGQRVADPFGPQGRALYQIVGEFEKNASADAINKHLAEIRKPEIMSYIVAVLRDTPPESESLPPFNNYTSKAFVAAGNAMTTGSVIEWLGAEAMLDDQLALHLRGLDYPLVNPATWTGKIPYLDRTLDDGRPWIVSRYESKSESMFRWCDRGAISDDLGNKYCSVPGIAPTAENLKAIYRAWVGLVSLSDADTVRRLILLAGKRFPGKRFLFGNGDQSQFVLEHSTAGLFATKALDPFFSEIFNPMLRVDKANMPGIDIFRWLAIYHTNGSTGAEPFFAALLNNNIEQAKAILLQKIPEKRLAAEKAAARAYLKSNPADPKDWAWVSDGLGAGRFPPLYVHLQKLAEKR